MVKIIVDRHGEKHSISYSNCDSDILEKYSWCVIRIGDRLYAQGWVQGKLQYLHRLLMKAKKGTTVDHIDGNSLNNERKNLRFATPSQNIANSRPFRSKKYSAYKGVTFCLRKRRWKSQIGYRGKNISIGYFDSETGAAKAYDSKAVALFGEYAWLNFKRT